MLLFSALNQEYMRYYFLFLLLITQLAFCQVNSPKDAYYNKWEIDKDIFRIMMTLSTDASLSFTGFYEREIKRPFTVVLKAGPAITREYLSTDVWGDDEYRWTLNAIAAGELRYYFNLNRRIKHEKTTRNFSAGYLSLEPYVLSKSLLILNRLDAEDKSGSAGAYINIGFQKQVNATTCYGAFFGTRFPGKIYSHSVDVLDIIHGGITIGRVF